MSTTGTVVNGRIELDEPEFFPEGTKLELVRWKVLDLTHDEAEEEDHPIPPPDETYEEHLASLRQSIADAKAGLGIPLDEAMALLRAEIEAMPSTERDR
jgi:hypothetical protein